MYAGRAAETPARFNASLVRNKSEGIDPSITAPFADGYENVALVAEIAQRARQEALTLAGLESA